MRRRGLLALARGLFAVPGWVAVAATAVAVGAGSLGATSASALTFAASMTGAQEVGPTGSPATGFTSVDIVGDTLTVDVTWSGLTGGNPAAAHIHCCIAVGTNVNVAVGFPAFPATLSGTYHHDFNLLDPAIYTASFLANFGGGTAAGASAALLAGLQGNMAYSNIHNATFPGGEIRGNLVQVPEPSALGLISTALLGVACARRARVI
jgi:hypothetical protein